MLRLAKLFAIGSITCSTFVEPTKASAFNHKQNFENKTTNIAQPVQAGQQVVQWFVTVCSTQTPDGNNICGRAVVTANTMWKLENDRNARIKIAKWLFGSDQTGEGLTIQKRPKQYRYCNGLTIGGCSYR
jgi:hypothetical protein